MRDTGQSEKGYGVADADSDAKLRQENLELKRQIQQLKGAANASHEGPRQGAWRPSALSLWAIFLAVTVLFVVAFFAGYLPLQKRQELIRGEALQQEQALPRVEVLQVGRSSRSSELDLPGSIQAMTEAPILSRSTGYLVRRLVDIGDRVKAGQLVAELEAPEMQEMLKQAEATLVQAKASLDQALANLEQGKSDLEFARVTAQRWAGLSAQGIVSRQDNDQYQTLYKSKLAAVQSFEKAVAVQKASIDAAQANLDRLRKLESFRMVRAPFDGVITLRNVDVGALVNSGDTLLFRIAQTATVRTYVNVPQANASTIRPGMPARLTVSNLPGRSFAGTVIRTSNTLDPSSRTMLVEVHVPNPDGALLPGMYAEVGLSSARAQPPLLVPSDALVVRSGVSQIAVLRPDHTVHLQKIEIGRDYGDRLEVINGLSEGDTIIPNPGDAAREGITVDPVALAQKAGH